MKTCNRCGESKSPEAFDVSKQLKDGRRSICKVCRKNYRTENRESILARASLYYKENREARLACRKAYRQENRETILRALKQYYRENRDSMKQQNVLYCRKNPEKRNFYKANRKSLKIKATPRWADLASIETIYEECAWLTQVLGEPYHVDHVVPLKSDIVCGLHWEGNLQILTAEENIRKGNRFWPDMP